MYDIVGFPCGSIFFRVVQIPWMDKFTNDLIGYQKCPGYFAIQVDVRNTYIIIEKRFAIPL